MERICCMGRADAVAWEELMQGGGASTAKVLTVSKARNAQWTMPFDVAQKRKIRSESSDST